MNNLLVHSFVNKKVVWLSENNKYLLVDPLVAELITALHKNESDHSILTVCRNRFDITEDQLSILIDDIRKTLLDLRVPAQKNITRETIVLYNFNDKNKIINKYYRINNVVFFVEYETSRAVEINHPKFSHFEIGEAETFDHHFKVIHQNHKFSLIVNGENVGSWEEKDKHFLGGKFSMQILQRLYKRNEDDWLGVFHAAGISNGKRCVMFLGDSGNGKSTLSAILMANGFDVLSDDFLPVEKKNKHACRFPAAISVKKNALSVLRTKFPELDNSSEYFIPKTNKIFRFLPLTKTDLYCVPCIALVFVKYEPHIGIQLSTLPKDVAFQKLIPDSWISPLEENVKNFFQWFSSLPCWQLEYSDNKAMVETVKKIFENEY